LQVDRKGLGMIKKILGVLCLIPMATLGLGFFVICGYAVWQEITTLKLYPTLLAVLVLFLLFVTTWGIVMLWRLGIRLIQNQPKEKL